MDQQLVLDLTSESAFEHVRASDGEVVGYIVITDDGQFVPFDLLHRQASEPSDLAHAEELLEQIGLSLLAESCQLSREGQALRVGIKELTRDEVTVGPLTDDLDPSSEAVDLTARWTYRLPASELTQ